MAVRSLDVVSVGPILLWVFLACAVPSHAQPASSGSADVAAGNGAAQTAAFTPSNGPAPSTEHGADTGHREEMKDAYLPWTPQASAVPPQCRTTWTVGPYTSVQVNVNEFGYNIPGDAANEPSIAVDPTDPGRLAIGWRQFDTVESNFRQAGWGYSSDGGHTWIFPGVLESGIFRSDPVLDTDAQGTFYYYSLSHEVYDWGCELFKSTDGGVTWTGPVSALGGDKAWMAIDRTNGAGSGTIYFTWNVAFTCCEDVDFARSTDGGATTPPGQKLPADLHWGTISVGPDGELYVAGEGFYVAKSTNAQYAEETPVFDFVTNVDLGGSVGFASGPNPGGLLGQVWVATDHSDGPSRGNVYLLCSVDPIGDDPLDVMFARSVDGGVTWSSPVRVNDDPADNGAWQWFGTMAVAPGGRIDVIWNDTRSDPGGYDSELYYAWSEDAGETWSANVAASPVFDPHLGWPQQNKLGDYYDMVSDDLGANVAYAATFNGEQDVYFLRIGTFDCNGNQIDDENDIAAGTSEDCNSNGVPDDCEPDCNTNGVADSCDLAGGTSADCNSNSVPDECEPQEDCNSNGVQDICDLTGGTSTDCTGNGTPDECEPDCNTNGMADSCDFAGGTSADCNVNGIPDECDIGAGTSSDADFNGIPDECRAYVDDDAPGDPGAGDPTISDPAEDGSAEHPFDAVQEAIDASIGGGEVIVLDGGYSGDGNRNLDFDGKGITVHSANGPDNCTIDCEGEDEGCAFLFLSGETGTSVVDGFTLRNGNTSHGGGIRCCASRPTITNCTISGNTAGVGGGIYCSSASSLSDLRSASPTRRSVSARTESSNW